MGSEDWAVKGVPAWGTALWKPVWGSERCIDMGPFSATRRTRSGIGRGWSWQVALFGVASGVHGLSGRVGTTAAQRRAGSRPVCLEAGGTVCSQKDRGSRWPGWWLQGETVSTAVRYGRSDFEHQPSLAGFVAGALGHEAPGVTSQEPEAQGLGVQEEPALEAVCGRRVARPQEELGVSSPLAALRACHHTSMRGSA